MNYVLHLSNDLTKDFFNLFHLVVHPLQNLHIGLIDAAVIIQAL